MLPGYDGDHGDDDDGGDDDGGGGGDDEDELTLAASWLPASTDL